MGANLPFVQIGQNSDCAESDMWDIKHPAESEGILYNQGRSARTDVKKSPRENFPGTNRTEKLFIIFFESCGCQQQAGSSYSNHV